MLSKRCPDNGALQLATSTLPSPSPRSAYSPAPPQSSYPWASSPFGGPPFPSSAPPSRGRWLSLPPECASSVPPPSRLSLPPLPSPQNSSLTSLHHLAPALLLLLLPHHSFLELGHGDRYRHLPRSLLGHASVPRVWCFDRRRRVQSPASRRACAVLPKSVGEVVASARVV